MTRAPAREEQKVPEEAGFSVTDRKAAKTGALLSVIGGVFLAAVRAMGFFLRAIFGGDMWGLYAIAWALIELISFFLLGGFNDAVVIFSSRAHHESDLDGDGNGESKGTDDHYQAMATILKVPFALALAVALGLHLTAPSLHAALWSGQDPLLIDLLQTLAWALPLLVLVQVPAEATRATLSFGWAIGIVQIAFPVLSVLCALGLYFTMTPGILAVAQGTLVALFLCVPVSLYAFSRHFEVRKALRASLSPRLHREALSFALPQSLNMMLNQGLVRLDSLMLSFFGVSANTIGVYSLVGDMTQVIRLTKMAYSGVFSPLVAKYRAQKNRTGVDQALDVFTRKTSSLGVAVWLAVMATWPLFIFQSGEKWTEPHLFAWLLCVGPLMSCFFGLCGNALLMYGRSRLLLLNALLSGTLNVVLNALLIPPLGLSGAALATAISSITISCLQMTELRNLERLSPHIRYYTRTLISAAGPALALILFAGLLWPVENPEDQWAPRLILALLCVAVYGLLQVILPGKRPFDLARKRTGTGQ